jgi:hypothetical protein
MNNRQKVEIIKLLIKQALKQLEDLKQLKVWI